MVLRSSTPSYWASTAPPAAEYPRLNRDLWVDAAVIGAGITGLTAALLLKQAGKKVAVLEGERIGSGTTGSTTAHITCVTDTPLDELLRTFGEEHARLSVEAQQAASDRIRTWVEGFNIDCDLQRQNGYRFAETEADAPQLERETEAAQRLGLRASMTREVPLPFRTAAAMLVEDQARFHALRYLHALAKLVDGGGCEVFEHTRAKEPEDGEPCRIETPGGTVTADAVIVAVHGPYLGFWSNVARVFPYASYVVGARVAGPPLDGLFWDTADPYHYIRRASDADPDLLLIGGSDHKTGQGGDERAHLEELELYARARFDVKAIDYRWSHELWEPADGLPYIGKMPRMNHVFHATGYSGVGMTFGTVAGMLMSDLALGRENAWAEVFDIGRVKPLASAREVITENLNVARRFVADRLAPGEAESVDDVPAGEGRLIKQGADHLAVYRAPDGQTHVMSAVCRHLGCIVQWNTAEKTWDCPCHGGRYTATGKIFAGPPSDSLEKRRVKDLEEKKQ
jgi:glycine/D-amino acid oxidase-like deaminating enzyme/nitrite reductase/ring-hydroxylating ferredoxin subunit